MAYFSAFTPNTASAGICPPIALATKRNLRGGDTELDCTMDRVNARLAKMLAQTTMQAPRFKNSEVERL
jgi:hypothetical protein